MKNMTEIALMDMKLGIVQTVNNGLSISIIGNEK